MCFVHKRLYATHRSHTQHRARGKAIYYGETLRWAILLYAYGLRPCSSCHLACFVFHGGTADDDDDDDDFAGSLCSNIRRIVVTGSSCA